MPSLARLLIALALVVVAGAASAERRVALVIGEDDYRSVRTLDNAVSDAQSIAGALDRLGFEVTLETNRDLRRMRRALDDFSEDGKGADVALVFFAGHGVEISGQNSLLPIDADASSLDALKATTLPLEEVRATVSAISRVGLIILDACRNDPFGAADGTGRGVVALAQAKQVRPGLGRVGRAENILFAFSAAPGEAAADGVDGHSPFAGALAKYLGTDGLEIRSVLTLVQQEVYDLTRGRQLPYVESGLPQLFFASSKREDLPERERLLLAMADVTPDLRAEVEQIAAAEQMPLAPLYGALISADLANTTIEARRAKLTEAAKAFASQRDELRTLSNADPEVTRLRQAAEDQLALGAYETARALHEQAIALDRRSAAMLDARARDRHLSEAATHSLKGGMARATLRYGDAITDYQNAAAIYDRYDNEDIPEDDRQRQLLALEALGHIETTVGNLAAAESAFGRLLRGDLARVAKDPANLDWQHFLAVGYVATGDLQVAQGNVAGALASYRQALVIAQQRLVAADPANEKWQRDLSVGQSKIGNMLVIQGDLPGALEAYQASLDILARLADAAPDNVEWTRDFSVALDRVGEVLMQQGRLSGAFEAYQASLTIRQRLAASDPGNFGRMLDLSVSQEKVGDVLMARGNAADALATYETSSVIAEHLSGSDPANTDWQRGLSIIQGKKGQALMALGDLSGAFDAHRSALVISQRLAAADPGNLRWQRDLSVIYDDISAVRLEQGNLAEAMENCRASLGIWQRLVASDPGNAGWQRDLSISHDRIGDVLVAQGDRPGALAEYEESLALRERLVASDPGNAIWLHDVIVSHVQIAQSGGDKAGHLQAALEIASAMEKNGTLAPSDVHLPGLLLEELAKAQNAAR